MNQRVIHQTKVASSSHVQAFMSNAQNQKKQQYSSMGLFDSIHILLISFLSVSILKQLFGTLSFSKKITKITEFQILIHIQSFYVFSLIKSSSMVIIVV